MLARVAENLYWIGRNIERCEHCSRYLKVQFFSTLDVPMSNSKDFILRSILFMSGSSFSMDTDLREDEVWRKVIFDYNNPNSILSIARNTRENARSIRNSISTELWESINKWFLYTKTLNPDRFSSSEIFSFTEDINTHIALIRSNVHNTLLQNDTWHFICMGIYTERAIQVLRILRSKISDSSILSNNGANIPLQEYQWVTLLRSLEAVDMYKIQSKGKFSEEGVLKLILDNDIFPRSIPFATTRALSYFSRIYIKSTGDKEILEQISARLIKVYKAKDFLDIDQTMTNITDIQNCVYDFHNELEKLYFQ